MEKNVGGLRVFLYKAEVCVTPTPAATTVKQRHKTRQRPVPGLVSTKKVELQTKGVVHATP